MFKSKDSPAESAQISNDKFLNEDIRVLLWDIDGTLLQSTRIGAFSEYFAPAMKEIYGSSGSLAGMNVSGMTDSQIVYEALKDEGFSPKQILSKFDEFTKILGEKMSRFVSEECEPYKLLPGVPEIIEATDKSPKFVNALLTGNFTTGAKIKLKYFDLWKYFENQPNTFGEISHDRRELAKCAAENINQFLKFKLNQEQFIVIGDTPNDIDCARSIGAKIISVATGRNHPATELAEYKPDAVLKDLRNTKKVLRTFETI